MAGKKGMAERRTAYYLRAISRPFVTHSASRCCNTATTTCRCALKLHMKIEAPALSSGLNIYPAIRSFANTSCSISAR